MKDFLKTTFVAGAMALSVAAGVSAVPTTAEARGFGGGFHGGGFHGGGFHGGGFRGGFRGGFGGGRFGYGYGRGFGYRGFGYRGYGFRGYGFGRPAFYGAAYPYWGGYRCGPYRRFSGVCGYPYGYRY